MRGAALLVLLAGCATPSGGHGTLTELSRVEGTVELCDHRVPAQVCTRHHPELVAQFKRAGDWCTPHGVPESQCLVCHPDLTFEPMPSLPSDADVRWLSRAGEDVVDLTPHVAKGKVTLVELSASWCAACRKVDGWVAKRLAAGDAGLAWRRIDVVSWESPVATRYLADVPSLPLLLVYGPDGSKRAQLHGADLDALERALREAR